MPTDFPGAIDTFTNPTAEDGLNSETVPHADQHANANDAITAIETYVLDHAIYVDTFFRVGGSEADNTETGDLTATRTVLGNQATITNDATLYLRRSAVVPAAATSFYAQFDITLAPDGSNSNERNALNVDLHTQPTANDGGLYRGIRVHTQHDSGAFNLSHATDGLLGGLFITAQRVASSTVTSLAGIRSAVIVDNGSVTNISGLQSTFAGAGGNTIGTLNHFDISIASLPTAITTHRGLNLPNLGGTGVATAVGLDIAAQSGAITNIGIRNGGNLRQTGYGSFIGGVGAPNSLSDGDVTVLRLSINNTSLGSGEFLAAVGTSTFTSGGQFMRSTFTHAATSNHSGQLRGWNHTVIASNSAGVTTNEVRALDFTVVQRQTGAIGTTVGIVASGLIYDTSSASTPGTITSAFGVRVFPFFSSNVGVSSGVATNLYGLSINGVNQAGLTVTTFRGLHVGIGSTSAFATTAFGLDIEALNQGSTNVGIRNSSTLRQIGNAMFGVDAAASALLHIQQQTLGSEVLRLESVATNDDPRESVVMGRAATTDATETTLLTVTIPANTTVMIVANVTARRTGGTAGDADDGGSFIRIATFKRPSGASQIGTTSAPYTQQDESWTVEFGISGNDARIRVTGAADNNITWHCVARVYPVGS